MANIIDHLASSPIRGAVFLAGVSIHITVLRHGEWHLQAPRLVAYVAALSIAMPCALLWRFPELSSASWLVLKTTSWLVLAFLAGLCGSMLVYRAAFHPLGRFPGPFGARLSNLYMTTLDVRGQIFCETRKLHDVYGPSELSIRNMSAIKTIHSSTSPCIKGPWYDMLKPDDGLNAARDKKEHSLRRKAWDKAFSGKALRNYEPRVASCTAQLVAVIDEAQGQPVDASSLFIFYGFDVMGEIGFGRSFNILSDGVLPEAIGMVRDCMGLIGAYRRLLWQSRVLITIPALIQAPRAFNRWLSRHVAAMERCASELPTVFSSVMSDYEAKGQLTRPYPPQLVADARLLVVAGSDTTAAALTCLFFELALHPEARATLQAELDRFEAADDAALSKIEYLGACINETLRLYPPAPSGVPRKTPPEGLLIDDVFIPGDTIVQIPTYAMGRDERFFIDADRFIPERWTTKPELTKEGAASIPFSYGPYSCVGMALAMMELRLATAQIVSRFDVELAPGCSPSAFKKGLYDVFTMVAPGLRLVFRPREAKTASL
ncbi:hypothetical protein CDD80_4116 [Ophiocordyceps camponoti-rufipedis]|uniref:Cytochrome P450 n=1 Tax=Ophiocordyceps camponoti-rufipedis TaxID=2004952 RepID=A0A2C5Z030_9HYPO|nr:hypothetical protein CDD80_4116 [Ophiocordyceps camponoti-rufipedis]